MSDTRTALRLTHIWCICRDYTPVLLKRNREFEPLPLPKVTDE